MFITIILSYFIVDQIGRCMSETTGTQAASTIVRSGKRMMETTESKGVRTVNRMIGVLLACVSFAPQLQAVLWSIAKSDRGETPEVFSGTQRGQMGAKRIGSLAIGIAVVGIVLNEMANLAIVNESNTVIDVSGIFDTAGAGLNLLVVGVIIAAAAVILNIWSGF